MYWTLHRNGFPSRGIRWVAGSRRRSRPGRRSGCRSCSCAIHGLASRKARRVPEQLLDHAERDPDGALTEHFHLLLHEDRYGDEAICAQLQRWQRDMGAAEYVRQLKALAADYSTEDLLPRITADTLVIHGRQDALWRRTRCSSWPTASPVLGSR